MKTEKAVFAGGCFWCTEAVFQNLKGVISVVSGYIGGTVKNPSYDQVSMGKTGHAEAIEIEFDSSVISYKELLYVFFYTHNPTTINQQGADVGTQYRSAIFYMTDEQKDMINLVVQELENEKIFDSEIVTEINPMQEFYSAEKYHQNYFNENQEKTYCQIIIFPKIEKLKSKFSHLLKDDRTI
jgi:peptide-methionine (S)-S-oxide reductase